MYFRTANLIKTLFFDQNGIAAPFIVLELNDHNSVSYKVVCEGVVFKATKKAKKAALMLISVY